MQPHFEFFHIGAQQGHEKTVRTQLLHQSDVFSTSHESVNQYFPKRQCCKQFFAQSKASSDNICLKCTVGNARLSLRSHRLSSSSTRAPNGLKAGTRATMRAGVTCEICVRALL
eukprot:6883995-Pyramimonas_sp.AAC.1